MSVQLYLFLRVISAAHFSRKFEKPSYGSDGSFLTLRTNDIVHFATYLLSKIVLYIIYVINCTYMGINWHRPRMTDHRRHTLNLSYYLKGDFWGHNKSKLKGKTRSLLRNKPRGASPGLWWYVQISIGNEFWGPLLNQKKGGMLGFTIDRETNPPQATWIDNHTLVIIKCHPK
jgi:hypothetical protein